VQELVVSGAQTVGGGPINDVHGSGIERLIVAWILKRYSNGQVSDSDRNGKLQWWGSYKPGLIPAKIPGDQAITKEISSFDYVVYAGGILMPSLWRTPRN